ncbi:hypothetical protein ACQUJO_09005 [Ralstonia pseudosolanacearum]
MKRAIRFTVAALLACAAAACIAAGPGTSPSLVPADDRRGAEQTLLTYPEWFLVHSPAEYARTVRSGPPHGFPFLAHVGQLWTGYAAVTREQVRGGHPLNPGYHLMIGVIATSTTVEYGLRAAYENTVGRLSWMLGDRRSSADDRFAAQAAQDYVDFIRQEPWYLFDFTARLKGLWATPLRGPGLPRQLERRYVLTSEYAVKAVYGKLIEWATRAIYTPARMTTAVVVDRLPAPWTPPPRVAVLARYPDGRALLALPRYFDFRIAATRLANDGIGILDIAGNASEILVTLWKPRDAAPEPLPGRVLFTQAMSDPPGQQRVAVLMPVARLSALLRTAPRQGWTVEHVYDY